jgi:hypothetical protein
MNSAAEHARRARRQSALLVLATAVLLVLGSLGRGPQADSLALEVQPVPFHPSDPGRQTAGPLRFRGGLWLRSPDPWFGGLSDLRVAPDGAGLLAVSDCGHGLVGTLVHDSGGDLVDLQAARLVELTGLDGEPLVGVEGDAESLAYEADDGLLIGFEKYHRIWRYARVPPFAGPAEPRPAPRFEEACPSNRGLETMVALDDGRLFVACEADGREATRAWVGRGRRWAAREYPLTANGPGGVFRPSAAALLPDGDVLVLERRFPPLEVRLVRLTKASLEGTGPLTPSEIVRLAPPQSVDNFEGIDVREDPSGATLVYLISDDNGCTKRAGVVPLRLQRTLLLLFELTD